MHLTKSICFHFWTSVAHFNTFLIFWDYKSILSFSLLFPPSNPFYMPPKLVFIQIVCMYVYIYTAEFL